MNASKRAFVFIVLIVCLGLAACVPTATTSPTQLESTNTAEAVVATLAPTAVPTVALPVNQVLLVAPSGVDSQTVQSVQAALTSLVQAGGATLKVLPVLNAADLTAQVKAVVLLESSPQLQAWMQAVPQAQFVVYSAQELKPAERLSVIRVHPEWEAFLAGYIINMLAPDWRAGGLLPNDGPLGSGLVEAFKNGGYYFCGACRSTLAPFVNFPVVASLPQKSDLAAWQTATDQLRVNILYALYVHPSIATPELLQGVTSAYATTLVGGQTPPEALRKSWAVSVRSDWVTPLQTLWPQLEAGQTGQSAEAQVVLADLNEGLLSTARQARVEQVRQALSSGELSPFTVAP